jgi:hypothetical protein
MLFAPIASLAALTLNVAPATPLLENATSVAVPNETVPAMNVTVPAGAAFPLAGVTIAVNCSVPVDATLAATAVTTVLVATTGADTVTTVMAVELLKLPAGT